MTTSWRAIILTSLLGLGACSTMTLDGRTIDTRYQSTNHDSRVRYLILHFTQLDFDRSVEALTRAQGPRRVSSHYLVGVEPPTIYRLVDEDRRAWHAGQSFWRGDTQLNASSIGIEIVNMGDDAAPGVDFADFPPPQIDAVVSLVRDIVVRHRIAPHRVLGHSDIAPQRKTDPGPKFPWRRLADEGLVPWPDPAAVTAALPAHQASLPAVSWFQQQLDAIGFEVPRHGELDEATRRVIANFQMKYRPAKFDGAPDAETAALLEVTGRPAGWLIREKSGAWAPYKPD
jgi:N-acetylmuramoyl-L-alanine amidase